MKKHGFFIFLIVILGALVYSDSLKGDFVFDDRALIVNNEYIRNISYLPKIFTSDIHYKETENRGTFHRPLQNISYMCDYAVWKLNPLGFRLTNLCLHVFNAVLIYILILMLFNEKICGNRFLTASITSMLFLVHPVQTQAVSYISGRADLLASFFLLLSGITFIKYIYSRKGNIYYYLSSLIFFVLGLLSKETVIILPLALLLYTRFDHLTNLPGSVPEPGRFVRWSVWWVLLPFFVIAALYTALRIFVFGYSSASAMPHGLYIRFLMFIRAIPIYFRLLIFPYDLHIERLLAPPSTFFEAKVFLSAVLLIAVCMVIIRVGKSFRVCLFGFLWFLIFLLPVSNIFPLNAGIAEHWLYLPSVGFFLIFAGSVALSRGLWRLAGVAGAAMLLAAFSCVTIRQNTYWKDNRALFERAIRFELRNYRLRNNLGIVYLEEGRVGEAVFQFQEALKLKPDYENARVNLDNAYRILNRLQKRKN